MLRSTRLFQQLLTVAAAVLLTAEAEGAAVEWSMSAPPSESGPRSFPAIAVHLQNRSAWPATLTLHFNTGPLRALTSKELTAELRAGEEKTVLYTLYVPPEAPGGSAAEVRARDDDGAERSATVRIGALAGCKATIDSVETRFLHPGESATYRVKIANTGNIPLHCAIHPSTSPTSARTVVTPGNLLVPAGASATAMIEVETSEVASFTSFVTSAEIETTELSGEAARQFLYFHTEAFPLPAAADSTQLFETLKGSLTIGAGGGSGNDGPQRGADGIVRESLTLEGMVTENTRLQLIESFTHPSQGNGRESSALSSLPSGNSRNFFHLGLYNPYFDWEAGEISTAPARLLSTREIGDGARVVLRPTGTDKLELEAFVERNSLTLNRKDVFGVTVGAKEQQGPLEWWRIGTLSKRGDVGPQGSNWDAIGIDTGWRIPLAIPLRAEFSVAAGENGEGRSGLAWLAGLHYNRTLRGETDDSPLKAGVEFASGGKGFPGQQNGRDDRRAYASYRFSSEPTYLEAYATYNDSEYKVVPNIEKTIDEEQSLLPDFLLTSQSRLINAGVRWRTLTDTTGGLHLPAGNLEFQETKYFTKSDFFDQTEERAASLNLEPFSQPATNPQNSQWHLTLLGRGGVENHQLDGTPATDSRFATLGADFNFSRPAPGFLEKIGGPGRVNAEFSGRYTYNFDDDRQALNRTGVTATMTASWETEMWSARIGAMVYSYADQGVSDRVWASVRRKVGKGWWAGVEAAYTHRGDDGGSGSRPDEIAVLFMVSHDFEIPVPWLPRRGQAAGRVFNDLNNNGRREPNEPGLEGVKVAVGSSLALTGPDGQFSLPPMPNGDYPVVVTPPEEVHFNQSTDQATDRALLNKGAITHLAIGLTKPTTCEGKVRFVREASEATIADGDKTEDLSGFEIIATDPAGRRHRSATRADGFFALYLEPGTYEIRVNPDSLKAQQTLSPTSLTVKVERAPVENLAFTVTERAKRIRKTFSAVGP